MTDAKESRPGNHLALLIGINGYAHVTPLRNAVRDAQEVARVLHELHGYETWLLLEDEASLAALRNALARLATRVTADTRLIIYFAGHGIATDSQDDQDSPQGFLVPQDAQRGDPSTFLAMSALYDALSALPCRHLLIVLDCCFAGAFRWVGTRSLLVKRKLYRERYERYLRDPAWQVITSSGHDELARDVLLAGQRDARHPDRGHSPFAKALIDGLRGEADYSADGVIVASELYLYIESRLAELEHRLQIQQQRPGISWLRRHDKGEFLFLHPSRPLRLPSAIELNQKNNPYRGLSAFEEEHHELFFGREQAADDLVTTVLGQPLTVLTGPSGGGKSSLLRAGLVPRLRRGSAWAVVGPLRPGERPLLALQNSMEKAGILVEPQRVSDDSGAPAGEWLASQKGQPILILVDQLEELVTLCASPTERQQFEQLLATALERQASLPANEQRLRVVCTVRSDFEPHFSSGPLGPFWTPGRVVLPPLSQRELRRVIEEPAESRLLSFEPPVLVDQLINEVVQMPGALPLLSFALSELYLKRLQRGGEDRALTAADYHELGGVVGSLRHRVEAIYQGLTAAEQDTMHGLLLRMLSSEGGELTRRRLPCSELHFAEAEEDARAQKVKAELAAARLVVEGSEVGGSPYVEPAHDALVRGWDRLWEWVREAEGAGGIRLLHRLTQAARDFEQGQGSLWDEDPRLDNVASWPTRQCPRLNCVERRFIEKSLERRAAKRLIETGGKTRPLAAVTGRHGGNVLPHRQDVQWAEFSPDGSLIVTASKDGAVKVWRTDGSGEVVVLAGYDGPLRFVHFTPNGQQVVTQGQDGVALLWQADGTGEPMTVADDPRRLLGGGVNEECFVPSADGQITLAAGPPGALLVRRADQPDRPIVLGDGVREGSREKAAMARLSPDASLVVAAVGRAARIWQTDGADQPIFLSPGAPTKIESALFSSDGERIVAACDDGRVRVLQASGAGQPVVLRPPDGKVSWAEFSPDGRYVLGLAGKVYVWSADGTGKPVLIDEALAAPASSDSRVSFSPRGQFVIITTPRRPGTEHAIYRLNGELVFRIKESEGLPWISPDDAFIAYRPSLVREADALFDFAKQQQARGLASERSTAEIVSRAWSQLPPLASVLPTAARQHMASLQQTTEQMQQAMLAMQQAMQHIHDPAQQQAMLQQIQEMQAQQMATIQQLVMSQPVYPTNRIPAPPTLPLSTTGSPDFIIVNSQDTPLPAALRDLQSLHIQRLDGTAEPRVLKDSRSDPKFVVFSPDGRYIVTAWRMSLGLAIWRADGSGEPVPLLARTGRSVPDLCRISTDGRQIAVAYQQTNIVEIFQLADPTQPVVLEGHTGRIHFATFSPDGTRLLTASRVDGTTRIWATDGSGQIRVLPGPPSQRGVFTPDGRWVLTETLGDEVGWLWPTDGGPPVRVEPAKRLQLSPDGRRILALPRYQERIAVWLVR